MRLKKKSNLGPGRSGRPEESMGSDLRSNSNGHERLFYKISEVSTLTGLESYVLRYWESEFPILHPQKSRGGQRIYKKKDIETILKIKQMLYDKGFTIAGARRVLSARNGEASGAAAQPLTKEFIYRLRSELADILRILSSHEKQN
jgi:DNA-binding transcriptional MerR regulator